MPLRWGRPCVGKRGGLAAPRAFLCVAQNLKTSNKCLPTTCAEALAANGVEADHVKVWQTITKLRRRHGLVMMGESGSRATGG